MKYKYIYFLSLILLGCNKNEFNEKEIDFSFSKLSNNPISDNVAKYSIIPLETKDEAYLTSGKKILIYGSKIYILENNMGKRHLIYIFSLDGKFINKINAQGRGAKEYQGIGDFDIHPKTEYVSILDPALKKIFSYDLNSEYKSELQLDSWMKEFKYMQVGEEIYKVFTTRSSKLTNEQGNDIFVYDDDNNFIYSALSFSTPISIAVGNGISLMSNKNEVNYLKPNTNIIYSVNENSTNVKHILKFPLDVLPADEIENVYFKGKNILHKYVSNINYFESLNTIYALLMHNKEAHFGLYNKESKESIIFNEQKDPSCNCGITLRVKGTYKNSFIIETDYSQINSVLNMLDPEKGKCSNPEIFRTVEELDMTSNPILLLVEFKI